MRLIIHMLEIDYALCATMLKTGDAVCAFVEGGQLKYSYVGKPWKTQLRAIVHGGCADDLDVDGWDLALSNSPDWFAAENEIAAATTHKLGVLCATATTYNNMERLAARNAIRGFLGNAVVVVRD